MQQGADLAVKNTKGLTPADLCSDIWLREAIASCAAHRHSRGRDLPWRFARESEALDDLQGASARLRFEPFFVPRAAVLKEKVSSQVLEHLGVEIFNQRPGQGLAFLVAAGCVRDFPVELSTFLAEHRVSLAQVGEFLGEDFSLSQTLRLEYINSVRLINTGVVSCLSKVFKEFHIPADMQKIDRITDGVAQIWWRQHEQLKEKEELAVPSQDHLEAAEQVLRAANGASGRNGATIEVEGLQLMRCLRGYDVLHQLMFSTVLLHWNLYANAPMSQRISCDKWVRMNADPSGLGSEDVDGTTSSALRHIHVAIYNLISSGALPQLTFWSSKPGKGAPPELELSLPRVEAAILAATHEKAKAAAEGWAMLVGGGLPSLTGAGATGTVTYRHLRSILSETTAGVSVASPATSRTSQPGIDHVPRARNGPRAVAPLDSLVEGVPSAASAVTHCRHTPVRSVWGTEAAGAGISGKSSAVISGDQLHSSLGEGGNSGAGGRVSNERTDRVWLALRDGMLFLAPKPSSWAPYAFVHLSCATVGNIDEAARTLTLLARCADTKDSHPTVANSLVKPAAATAQGQETEAALLQLIFLLPDGRWQVLELPSLRVQFPDVEQLKSWTEALSKSCDQYDTQDHEREI
jgi:hypothetical protein